MGTNILLRRVRWQLSTALASCPLLARSVITYADMHHDGCVGEIARRYRLFSGCWSSCHCPANEHRHLTPNRTNPDNHFGWVEVGNHFLQYDIEEAADEKPFIADNPCSTIGQAVRTKPVTSRKLGRHLMSSGWIPGTPPQCQRFELVER